MKKVEQQGCLLYSKSGDTDKCSQRVFTAQIHVFGWKLKTDIQNADKLSNPDNLISAPCLQIRQQKQENY